MLEKYTPDHPVTVALANYLLKNQTKKELRALAHGESNQFFEMYANDPVGFCEVELGETLTDDIKRMMESVRDYPITIAKSATGPGKTFAAARAAVWWYETFPGSQVYTAAAPPEGNLRRLLWGEIGSIVHSRPQIFRNDKITSLNIQSHDQHFLTGVTIPMSGTSEQQEAKFSGKHAPYLLFIIDEGDAVPDEVYRGIEGCMSGGHARLLIMFNPRAEMGEVYTMERDKLANIVHLSAFNHPNVRTGKDIIPGAVTRDKTVERINKWCRPLQDKETQDETCFELPEFLVGVTALDAMQNPYPPLGAGWYKIMEPAFNYMVLGQYPAQAINQLISREWLLKARKRWDDYVTENGEVPPLYTPGIMGLDVGEFGPDLSVQCFRYGGFVEKLLFQGGVDTMVTGDWAIKQYKKRDLERANVDGTGVGAGVAPHLQRNGCSANSVKVASSPTKKSDLGEFGILRDQLWWSTREWLRTEDAMLPPDEDLLEELKIPTYEVVKGKVKIMGKQTMRELLKRSPDRAEALIMTFYSGGFFEGCDLG